ncbi:HAD family hydrolase [Phycicoccus flavus]|uniref:HAD family hydrolase n=1 Tax=Phycicoccus flavus TaxID=2502783 RepID=UPI000FEBAA07|nr:HAD family hydrolase [Phycicoccus flavus]NHA68194.1 HAD family hydrolase [Phycicoccus flavus]
MGPVLPSGRPRVVASDLDGTLLRGDTTVSDRTRAALRRTEEAGVDVVFVTARPPRWIRPVADAVAGHGVVVAGNGAFVVDARTLEVVETRGYTHAAVLDLVAPLRAAFPDAHLALERSTGMVVESGYTSPYRGRDDWLVLDRLEDADDVPTGKLLVRAREEHRDGFLEAVAEVVGERGHVAHSGVDHLAEISPPGVTKAAGLARWCQTRGVDAEHVWAFGDMPNDLPMLAWAGASFAVANAHDDVRAAATHTCPSNEDDGVAVVLEAMLERADPSGPTASHPTA